MVIDFIRNNGLMEHVWRNNATEKRKTDHSQFLSAAFGQYVRRSRLFSMVAI
jgi:hypothetical protein